MSMTLPDIASIASWRLERASRPNGGGVKPVYFGRCTGYATSQAPGRDSLPHLAPRSPRWGRAAARWTQAKHHRRSCWEMIRIRTSPRPAAREIPGGPVSPDNRLVIGKTSSRPGSAVDPAPPSPRAACESLVAAVAGALRTNSIWYRLN